jgi:hypothetical protein
MSVVRREGEELTTYLAKPIGKSFTNTHAEREREVFGQMAEVELQKATNPQTPYCERAWEGILSSARVPPAKHPTN